MHLNKLTVEEVNDPQCKYFFSLILFAVERITFKYSEVLHGKLKSKLLSSRLRTRWDIIDPFKIEFYTFFSLRTDNLRLIMYGVHFNSEYNINESETVNTNIQLETYENYIVCYSLKVEGMKEFIFEDDLHKLFNILKPNNNLIDVTSALERVKLTS